MTDDDSDRAVVLVVDDDERLADLYTEHLEDEYEVRTAYDGEGALEAVDDTVEVVLLDRRMPGLSGDEVLEALGELDFEGAVIMLTAVSPDYDLIEMGFDEYLVKPITLPELSEAVSRNVTLLSEESGPRRLYALLSKRYTLETRKSASELHEDDRYLDLLEEVEELRDEIPADIADRIDAQASSAAFGARDGVTVDRPDFDEIERDVDETAESGNGGPPERTLGDSEADVLLDHVSDPIFVVDGDSRIIDCNDAFSERFGYAREDIKGEPSSVLNPSQDGEKVQYQASDGSDLSGRTTIVSYDRGSEDGQAQAVVVTEIDGADGSSQVSPEEITDVARLLRHEVGKEINILTALLGRLRADLSNEHQDDIDQLLAILSRTGTAVDEVSEYLTSSTPTLPSSTEAVELGPAIERALDQARSVDPDVTFDVDDIEPVEVQANELLDVLIRNLLENAVKHHDGDHPQVEVDVEVDAERVKLLIADDGPGIPKETRSVLTEPESRGVDSGGMGLGLYLVDRLVDAYDGSIRFEDREPRGTKVVVEFARAE